MTSPRVCDDGHDLATASKLESYDVKPHEHGRGDHRIRVHVYICMECGQKQIKVEKVEVLNECAQENNPFEEDAWRRHI